MKPMEYKTVGDYTITNVILAGKEGHELFHKQTFIGRYETYELARDKWKELTA
jgi:hypothetical protein